MEKVVVVINGSGGVGKDTLCQMVGKHYPVMNVSSIDPIKKIASENGWKGEKTAKSRKFLADLKEIFIEYNDLPLQYLLEQYSEFLAGEKQVLFVHIREPKEIDKFKEKLSTNCVTLLIRGRSEAAKEWKNAADDDVEKYVYDFYYDNQKPLNQVEKDFLRFFRTMLNWK